MGYESIEYSNAMKQAKYRDVFDRLRELLINSHYDMDEAITSTLNLVCDAARAEAGTFWFYSKYGDGLIHSRASYGGKDLSGTYLTIDEGITGQVIKTGEAYVAQDVTKDKNWSNKVDKESSFKTKSLICVPLSSNDEVFGCIQLVNKIDDSLFDDNDVDIVKALANEISTQFTNLNILCDGREVDKAVVLFADLRGYAVATNNLDTRKIAELLNEYLSYVTIKIKNNNGVVNKYLGDCVLGYWEADVSHKDAVADAMKAAIEIIDDLRSVGGSFKEKYGYDIKISIGMALGPAYIGNIGTSVLSDHTIVGRTVNLAYFMQEEAQKNAILVNEDMVRELKRKYNFKRSHINCGFYKENIFYFDDFN